MRFSASSPIGSRSTAECRCASPPSKQPGNIGLPLAACSGVTPYFRTSAPGPLGLRRRARTPALATAPPAFRCRSCHGAVSMTTGSRSADSSRISLGTASGSKRSRWARRRSFTTTPLTLIPSMPRAVAAGPPQVDVERRMIAGRLGCRA